MISKPQLIAKMRAVARRRGTKTLPRGEFRRVAKVSDRAILAHFDGWAEACAAAGLRNVRNYSWPTRRSSPACARPSSRPAASAPIRSSCAASATTRTCWRRAGRAGSARSRRSATGRSSRPRTSRTWTSSSGASPRVRGSGGRAGGGGVRRPTASEARHRRPPRRDPRGRAASAAVRSPGDPGPWWARRSPTAEWLRAGQRAGRRHAVRGRRARARLRRRVGRGRLPRLPRPPPRRPRPLAMGAHRVRVRERRTSASTATTQRLRPDRLLGAQLARLPGAGARAEARDRKAAAGVRPKRRKSEPSWAGSRKLTSPETFAPGGSATDTHRRCYAPAMKFTRITIDPNVCTGKPCIRGLRFAELSSCP